MKFTGERVVPWDDGMRAWSWVLRDHLARYLWAMNWVSGKDVVDLGCGTGYGTFMLSWVAASIVGIDVDQETIGFATSHFRAPNVKFCVGDLNDTEGDFAFRIPDAQVYVAFEILEHLACPEMTVVDKVRSKGILLWSIPVNDPGQFHKHVYSAEAAALLVPGSAIWHQYADGQISLPIPGRQPKYVLGAANV